MCISGGFGYSNSIEVVMIDGEPWFNANQVATTLGYTNPSKAISDNISSKYNRQLDLMRQGKQPLFISEPGLYQLVMKSKLPDAGRFSDQVWGCDRSLLVIGSLKIFP